MNFIKPDFWQNNNFISSLIWPLTLITRIVLFLKKNQKTYKPLIKTICVGNIYLGGTGKTQLVLKLNEILKRKFRIFVIKKKYKNQIDEQRLIKNKAHLISPKKRTDALKEIQIDNKNIGIFDDGLQDKSIEYSIKIVCFNSISAVGNKKLLPSGPLREQLSELINYHAVFINGNKNKELEKNIKKYNKKIKIFYAKYFLKNKKYLSSKSEYLAFCGIGTPENFFKLLKENRIIIKKKIIFPDHYDYKLSDINDLKAIAKKQKLKIITTEKDFMKIKEFKNNNIKYTTVDLKIDNLINFKKFLFSQL